ncbi:hypothetical protein [Vibrio chagasii]|uniref:hypothetical protein n=1 Tax=Vibrio chagasii TaxID=170679 RepID=UPI003D9FE665
MNLITSIFTTVLLVMISNNVYATEAYKLDVLSDVIVLDQMKSSEIINVRNDSSRVIYARIDIYEIDSSLINSGKERLTLVRGKGKQDGLIATPPRLAVPAHSTMNVRVIFTGKKTKKDRHFKVRFIPIAEYEYKGIKKKTKEANIFFSVSSTSFVSVKSSEPKYNYFIHDTKIKNDGNTLILLKNCMVSNGVNRKVYTEIRLPSGREYDFANKFNSIEGANVKWNCDLVKPNVSVNKVGNN